MSTDRVRKAIATTRRTVDCSTCWNGLLAQRAELSRKWDGAVYEGVTSSALEQMLLAADWEEYSHPAVASDLTAFKAAIPGRCGLVELQSLPRDARVVFGDPVGMIAPELNSEFNKSGIYPRVEGVQGEMKDFTVLLLGLYDGAEVAFTFFPGDPAVPSVIECNAFNRPVGKLLSVEQALELGLLVAQIGY